MQVEQLYSTRESTISRQERNKYDYTYKGPFPINKVQTNGTVTIQHGIIQEKIKTIWIKPYH